MSQVLTETRHETSSPQPILCAELRLGNGEPIYCGAENAMIQVIVKNARDHLDQPARSFKKHAACDTDSAWLPLVLYGDVGVGKSFLAHRLATYWLEREPEAKVSLLTAADVARSLQRSELNDDIDHFTAQQKNASLVVIDDVHQLSKKKTSDIWVTNLLDDRIRRQKPTVITCQRPIAAMKLTHRLRSRLLGGLCVRLVLPGESTRRHIIEAGLSGLDRTYGLRDVESLTKRTVGKTVRGVWSQVASFTMHPALQHEEPSSLKRPTAEFVPKLLQTTARKFGVRLSDIKGPSRRKNTVLARAVAMFLLRTLTKMSLSEVGKHFRNRDHTTVRHACNKISRLLIEEPGAIGDTISSICQSLHVELPADCLVNPKDQCA